MFSEWLVLHVKGMCILLGPPCSDYVIELVELEEKRVVTVGGLQNL